MKLLTVILAMLLLTACHGIQPGDTYMFVQKDFAVRDRVERWPYIPQDRLIVACVKFSGIFTRDKAACMVPRRGVCYYLTAPGDTAHDHELTAACNGWRPV